ncbi:vomeronasal type-2 receptor 26-like [Hemicordylus capensis]|uniref:vomeronasal type-2 receptor 26-like n=1 Tax=Hemicordylus capensis TaxID=884348 RepID=UPI0023029522|nr:vomeronasal type-2 receptor 26-like [Hemicordylus capensis]
MSNNSHHEVLVLGIIIKHKDIPIVKANNRDLTYTLLVSLFFCFLLSLLYLGQPTRMTCYLQLSAVDMTFTVAMSCMLAKSITVILAFLAINPGSSLKKWVDFYVQSMIAEIIAGCNQGSAMLFCLDLTYNGILSSSILTEPFLARKLLDTFNEAKFITFSVSNDTSLLLQSDILMKRNCKQLHKTFLHRHNGRQMVYEAEALPAAEREFSSERTFNSLCSMVTKFYQHVLALAFAIKEINENPKILPNVTLGFRIHDSYNDASMTYHTTLGLLFKSQRFPPNYKCDAQDKLIAIIGGLSSDVSFRMAEILHLYKKPQLTYGSFASKEDTSPHPSFYHMAPNDAHQFMGIIQLLQHFGWSWVGLFAEDDDSGDHFLQTLEPLLSQNAICSAFTERIPRQVNWPTMNGMNNHMFLRFTDRKAHIFITYAETLTFMWLWYLMKLNVAEYEGNNFLGKVWILTAHTDFVVTKFQSVLDFQPFKGAFSFQIRSNDVLGFQAYLQNVKPKQSQGDGFLEPFWEQAFKCSLPDPRILMKVDGVCTGNERLENLPGPVFEMSMTGHSYCIYNAAYAVAHALHAMDSSRSKSRAMVGGRRRDIQDLHPWQLHPFLQGVSFNNSAGERVSFNEKWELGTGFDIMNLHTLPNNSFLSVKVGKVDPSEGKTLVMDEDQIVWHRSFNQMWPLSVCSDSCQAGYQKIKRDGEKFCCYDCVPCPEGMVSNQKDTDDCLQCPEDQYPSRNKDQCIPKVITSLSYEEPLGISFASIAASFSLVTVLVLGIFIKHKDTPLVKANYRNFTYIILVLLLLCFLLTLLFLGQLTKRTCYLQRFAFGILFTVVMSCILAKNITVVVAFLGTMPGSSMTKWMGKRLITPIVLSCSIIRAAIDAVWLGVSPPFVEFDMQSVTGEIGAKCNKGSVTIFYIGLAYNGLLSIVSYTVAFLARKLPNLFNEAKFISFSLLMFPIVWLCYFPTYQSSKGKYKVAVDSFSIIASSAVLLGCIFAPKCYIVVLRPALNNKEKLKRRKRLQ